MNLFDYLATLKVGDTVRCEDGYSRLFTGKVIRVTPGGQIVVEHGRDPANPLSKRFDKYGREIGSGSIWRQGHILCEEDYQRRFAEDKRENIARALVARVQALPKLSVKDPAIVETLEKLVSDIKLYQADR